jgi:CheY-like chemotaxis protein
MTKIAIVNDDIDFIDAIKILLLDLGSFEVTVIHEGEKAYQILKKTPPDLIILDIRMDTPHRGWSILDLLKLDPATGSIPVIVCTATTINEEKTNWLKKHNVALLLKPFEIVDLTALIDIMLQPPAEPRLTKNMKAKALAD